MSDRPEKKQRVDDNDDDTELDLKTVPPPVGFSEGIKVDWRVSTRKALGILNEHAAENSIPQLQKRIFPPAQVLAQWATPFTQLTEVPVYNELERYRRNLVGDAVLSFDEWIQEALRFIRSWGILDATRRDKHDDYLAILTRARVWVLGLDPTQDGDNPKIALLLEHYQRHIDSFFLPFPNGDRADAYRVLTNNDSLETTEDAFLSKNETYTLEVPLWVSARYAMVPPLGAIAPPAGFTATTIAKFLFGEERVGFSGCMHHSFNQCLPFYVREFIRSSDVADRVLDCLNELVDAVAPSAGSRAQFYAGKPRNGFKPFFLTTKTPNTDKEEGSPFGDMLIKKWLKRRIFSDRHFTIACGKTSKTKLAAKAALPQTELNYNSTINYIAAGVKFWLNEAEAYEAVLYNRVSQAQPADDEQADIYGPTNKIPSWARMYVLICLLCGARKVELTLSDYLPATRETVAAADNAVFTADVSPQVLSRLICMTGLAKKKGEKGQDKTISIRPLIGSTTPQEFMKLLNFCTAMFEVHLRHYEKYHPTKKLSANTRPATDLQLWSVDENSKELQAAVVMEKDAVEATGQLTSLSDAIRKAKKRAPHLPVFKALENQTAAKAIADGGCTQGWIDAKKNMHFVSTITFHHIRSVYNAIAFYEYGTGLNERIFTGAVLGHDSEDLTTGATYSRINLVFDNNQAVVQGDVVDDGGLQAPVVHGDTTDALERLAKVEADNRELRADKQEMKARIAQMQTTLDAILAKLN